MNETINGQVSEKPLSYRILDIFIDQFLCRTRWLLVPFHVFIKACLLFSRLIWFGSNEYMKSKFSVCGQGVRIHGRFRVTSPRNLSVGNNVHVNENAFIRAEGGLSIGDNTHIAKNLVVYTMNHDYHGMCLPYDHKKLYKSVYIGKNVWIGINVTIVPGVTIGDGAVIGMGCVVTKDVPPFAIVGTVPQRLLKNRDQRHYEELKKRGQYGGMSGYPNKS